MTDPDVRTVTKRELVNRIAEEMDQTKVVVREVLQKFLDSIVDELAQGNRIEFRDFGVFEVRTRAARMAQNPRTLEKVPVPAKKVVKFKVGRVMRLRVCEDVDPVHVGDVDDDGIDLNGSGSSTSAGGHHAGGAGGPANGDGGAGSNGTGKGRPQPPQPPPSKPGSPF